jgi:hypothetical protein
MWHSLIRLGIMIIHQRQMLARVLLLMLTATTHADTHAGDDKQQDPTSDF